MALEDVCADQRGQMMLLPRRIHVRQQLKKKKDFLARYCHGGMNVSCLWLSSKHYRGLFDNSLCVWESVPRPSLSGRLSLSLTLSASPCRLCLFVSPVPRVCLFRLVPFVVDCRTKLCFPQLSDIRKQHPQTSNLLPVNKAEKIHSLVFRENK